MLAQPLIQMGRDQLVLGETLLCTIYMVDNIDNAVQPNIFTGEKFLPAQLYSEGCRIINVR